MAHRVKGILFADYVRMIRSHKRVDWSTHLEPEDEAYLHVTIEPEQWYPMETFERFGNAILREIAGDNVEAVRMWGRLSVDELARGNPTLVEGSDPIETLHRFRVLRSTYFDFEALRVQSLSEGHAEIVVDYGMGDTAEEAAAHQTLGFFERLLQMSGAVEPRGLFEARRWAGDERTLLVLTW